MNSCLYEIAIMHQRLKPKKHQFTYHIFMAYLDLDEIPLLSKTNRLFGHNRMNLYSLYDKDHLDVGGKGIKDNIKEYLRSKNIDGKIEKIMLLTNLRMLGYVFNPVSFYFCFDGTGVPVCVVPEIGNTFKELKPFFIGADKLQDHRFQDIQPKYFYVSPYTELDDDLEFRLGIPDKKLNIFIDTQKGREKIIVTSMIGERKPLRLSTLLWQTLKCPFVTLKVITLIHWHALVLFLKGLPHHNKEVNSDLQREVYRGWSKPKGWFTTFGKGQA